MYVGEIREVLDELDDAAEVLLVVGWSESEAGPDGPTVWRRVSELRRVELKTGPRRELNDEEFQEIADATLDAWGPFHDMAVLDVNVRRVTTGAVVGLVVGDSRDVPDAPTTEVRGW